LRKRLIRAVGWVGFVGGGVLTPRLAARTAAKLWVKLPSNAGRRKDNRPWPGSFEMVDVGLKSPLAVETWEPHSAPATGRADRPDSDQSPGDADPAGVGPPSRSPRPEDGLAEQREAERTASSNEAPTAAEPAEAEPKTVLLMHGWGGWRGQVGAFVKPLTDAGFRVVAVDTLSHGDSGPGGAGPHHSTGGELMRSFEAFVATAGQPYGVIAHSLGCGAACRAILRGNLAVERLTLVSPNPDMAELAEKFGQRLGFTRRTRRLLMAEMERLARGRLTDFTVAEAGASGMLPDALVIHDAADKESPYSQAQQIDELWPGAALMTTHGLGHHRILIDPAVVEQAAANISR
jgi:pimeloyl-ACP methyl ester carboxylesterase